MRLVVFHGGTLDEASLDAAWKLVTSASADRVLLFATAARRATETSRAAVEQSEDAYLAAAAQFLLSETNTCEPPTRPVIARAERHVTVVARPRPESFWPYAVTARFLEMAGTLLIMGVPDEAALEAEDLENAHLWIVGAGPWGVEQVGSRAVVRPGDAVVTIDVALADARITARRPDGSIIEQRTVSLQPLARLQVQA